MTQEVDIIAKNIGDVGMMAVTAAFFLVLTALLWVACFRWFKSIIDGMIKGNNKMVNDLLVETRKQNDMLTDISEGLRPETQLRIKHTTGVFFDLAIEKHMQPNLQSHKDAVEKLWDVLERLKTYYADLDKRQSADKIIEDMACGQDAYKTLFSTEFKELTTIGNDFRIRHHETNKIDIVDIRHYDYFFNRCLALIALALQYLQ